MNPYTNVNPPNSEGPQGHDRQGQLLSSKFEYKMNEKKANQLDAEGWDLAAIDSTSTAGIAKKVPTYVFKRPK